MTTTLTNFVLRWTKIRQIKDKKKQINEREIQQSLVLATIQTNFVLRWTKNRQIKDKKRPLNEREIQRSLVLTISDHDGRLIAHLLPCQQETWPDLHNVSTT